MVTTIQVSGELLDKLQKMKIHNNESYEDIIWDLLEDRMELSEGMKKELLEYGNLSSKDKKNFKTLEQVKRELGF